MPSSVDPYVPPATTLEPFDPPSAELRYAGFWQRFGAYWIDFLVMLPLIGIHYYFGEKSRLFGLYWFVPGLLIGLAFHVWLVHRFGGTPGKLLLGIRIAMVDGAAVTLKAACLRYSVLFVLSVLGAIALLMAALSMSDEAYHSLGYMARAQELARLAPPWYGLVTLLTSAWVWGEFLTMLFNKRRRAVHDYMAGTVVVSTAVAPLPVAAEPPVRQPDRA